MKIAIDSGHGLYTLGKRCLKSIDPKETREWVLNNRIATRVTELLAEYEDVETLRLDDPTGKTDVPLSTRAAKANSWGADLLLSLHHNAGLYGKKGGGIVIFTYLTYSATEKALQKLLYNELVARGGLTGRSEPLAKQNLAMVRDPKCDALLIEYGFMDSITDTPVILTAEYAENMAQGTVAALVKQYKLKKKEEEIDMTRVELEAIIDEKIQASEEKVYHYWSQLPSWAAKPVKAMYDAGYFAGSSPSDLNLGKTKMEILVCIASVLKKQGILTY